jgi:O-antigen ligase
MIFVYLYLIELLIRPQDWVPAILGWPTHWLIVLPGLIYGLTKSNNRKLLIKNPESILLALYVLFIFISTYINVGYEDAHFEFTKYLKVGSIYYFLFLLIDNDRKFISTLVFFLLLTVLLSQHAIQQAVTGTGWAGITLDPNYEDIRARWLGVWDGSNGFGLLLGVATPFGIELFLKHKQGLYKFLGISAVLALLGGVYCTNSRGSTLAVIVGLLFYIFTTYNIKKSLFIFIVFLSFAGALLPSRMSYITTAEESAHQRAWSWEQGIQLYKNNPIIGIGKEQFPKKTEDHIAAHNNFVQVFAELGSIGYFLFIAFFWFPLKRGLILQVRHTENSSLNLFRIINTSLIIFLVGSYFIIIENDLMTLLLAMVSVISWNNVKQNDLSQLEKVSKYDLLGIIACMLVIYFSIWLIAIKEII